jgi:PKD repeat protein
VTWEWTFGDGGSSTARNPSHAYDDPGTYTITLTATSSEGGTDRVSQDVTVGP